MQHTRLIVAAAFLLAGTAHAEEIDLPLAIGTYVASGESCGTSDETRRITYWGGENGFNTADTTCKARGLRVTEDEHYILRQKCDSPTGTGILITSRFTLPTEKTIRMENVTYRYCGKPVKR